MQLVYYSSQSVRARYFSEIRIFNIPDRKRSSSPQSLGQCSGIEHYIFFPVGHENIQQMKQIKTTLSFPYFNSGN